MSQVQHAWNLLQLRDQGRYRTAMAQKQLRKSQTSHPTDYGQTKT